MTMLHQEYQRVLHESSQYVLLRFPHIIPREIPDLDLLFETREVYQKTIEKLQKEGYIVLSKEKLRTFLGKKAGKTFILFDMYLHVSWWGWKALDKKPIFAHKDGNYPRDEDELLIYIAQGIFKNFGYNKYKTQVVRELLKKDLDWNYIDQQVKRNGWLNPFYNTLNVVRRDTAKVPLQKSFVLKSFLSTMLRKPKRINILLRSMKFFIRKFKKQSTVICLIGVDGSGKSTLIELLSKRVEEFFDKLECTTQKLYFGWTPFLPTTTLISKILKKKKYSIVKEMNKSEKTFSVVQELMLFYYYIEYLSKYLFTVFPQRFGKNVVLIDRYFYDMYVHYSYAKNSKIFSFLMKWYPQPDYTFFLDVPVSVLDARKDEMTVEELTLHRKRYQELQSQLHLPIINTEKSLEECVDQILEEAWKTIARRVA